MFPFSTGEVSSPALAPRLSLSSRLLGLRVACFAKKGMRYFARNLPLLLLLLPMQVVFAKTLLTSPTRQLVYRHARLPLKHLSSHYLALSLTPRQRLASVSHHYALLNRQASREALARLYDGGIVLWRTTADNTEHTIELGFPFSFDHPGRRDDHEGDLLMTFRVDGVACFALSFTAVPLAIAQVRPPQQTALFIGRIQGVGNNLERLRGATRALGDITPRDLLWGALEGVAQALGIRQALGVSNDSHVLSRLRGNGTFAFDYDHHWQTIGGTRTPQGMYLIGLPLRLKALEDIPQKHRRRTAQKRLMKEQVRDTARANFARELLKTATVTYDAHACAARRA